MIGAHSVESLFLNGRSAQVVLFVVSVVQDHRVNTKFRSLLSTVGGAPIQAEEELRAMHRARLIAPCYRLRNGVLKEGFARRPRQAEAAPARCKIQGCRARASQRITESKRATSPRV